MIASTLVVVPFRSRSSPSCRTAAAARIGACFIQQIDMLSALDYILFIGFSCRFISVLFIVFFSCFSSLWFRRIEQTVNGAVDVIRKKRMVVDRWIQNKCKWPLDSGDKGWKADGSVKWSELRQRRQLSNPTLSRTKKKTKKCLPRKGATIFNAHLVEKDAALLLLLLLRVATWEFC